MPFTHKIYAYQEETKKLVECPEQIEDPYEAKTRADLWAKEQPEGQWQGIIQVAVTHNS